VIGGIGQNGNGASSEKTHEEGFYPLLGGSAVQNNFAQNAPG